MPCAICSDCAGPYDGPARSGITIQPEEIPVRADRRIYTNADKSKVVEESSPDAAILLAAEGDDVPDADARRLGLMDKPKAKPAAEPESKAVSGPPENKAQKVPDKKADEGK